MYPPKNPMESQIESMPNTPMSPAQPRKLAAER
jgi:hypothetical protein